MKKIIPRGNDEDLQYDRNGELAEIVLIATISVLFVIVSVY
jgi:hypothetical protein